MAVKLTLAQWFKEHPEIAAEWDSEANTHINPEIDGYSASKMSWWVCDKGHRYNALLYTRTLYSQGCPYCAGKRAWAGFNDLATLRPDVLPKWDYEKNVDITPQEVSQSSHKLVWWKCEKGHSWQARVQSITNMKEGFEGCPYCDGKKVLKGENDLVTLFPEIAKEWCYELNDITPDEVIYSSFNKYWWKCEKGHTWEMTPYYRTGKHKGKCPYCSNLRVWTGFNDLETLAPHIAAEWNYELNGDLKPSEVSKTARKKVWWKCSEGHVWEAVIYARTWHGTNCPYCSRRR